MRQVVIHAARGFTLLEMLVVVVLIGITFTFATLNFDRDNDELAYQEARRFAALLEHVREEAIILGQAMAVDVDDAAGSYYFLSRGEQWTEVLRDDVLRRRRIAESVRMELSLPTEGQDETLSRIVLQSLGEITPFRLSMIGDTSRFDVYVDEEQRIAVQRAEPDAL